jgi:3-oxoacyl-[acyl-carrier-protein] synthase-3
MNKITQQQSRQLVAMFRDYASNKVLETMVDTNDEWILVGISERRLLKLRKRNFLPCNSGSKDLIQRQHKSEEIDLIIATTTPDLPVASTGVYAASQIGAVNAFAFDLQAACSGFLFRCQPLAAYIESGNTKNTFSGADKMSSIIYRQSNLHNIWRWWRCCLFEPNFEGFEFRMNY